MQVTIDVPDIVAQRLQENWQESDDDSHHDLDWQYQALILIHAYQKRLISSGRLKELLGFATTVELDAYLQRQGVELPYDEGDFLYAAWDI